MVSIQVRYFQHQRKSYDIVVNREMQRAPMPQRYAGAFAAAQSDI